VEEVALAGITAAVTVRSSEAAAKQARACFAAFLWHSGQADAAQQLAEAGLGAATPRPPTAPHDGGSASGAGDGEAAVFLFDDHGPRVDGVAVGATVWAWPPTELFPRYGTVKSVAKATHASLVGGGRLVGMRLEAKDRKNPRLTCVATVAEVIDDLGDGGPPRVKVHFDGWTAEYDYVTTLDNEDLHPAGNNTPRRPPMPSACFPP
jgi:hypothetical protein